MVKRFTKEQFIDKANMVHSNFYLYHLIKYKSNKIKIEIICPIHGPFWQGPCAHLRGQGCKECFLVRNKNQLRPQEEYLQICKTVHNNKYDYSLVNYIGAFNKIKIICLAHGMFEQDAGSHRRGVGCPKCAVDKTKLKQEEFIYRACKIHNNKYDYSLSKYINSHTNIIIICKDHGEFVQNPYVHLRGQGCRKCGCTKSKPEEEWLDSLNIPQNNRQIKLKISDKKFILADAFVQDTNTIYEFYGDFWHGNPNKYDLSKVNKKIGITFGELYNQTIEKEKLIIKAGYNLISIWEQDFKKLKK